MRALPWLLLLTLPLLAPAGSAVPMDCGGLSTRDTGDDVEVLLCERRSNDSGCSDDPRWSWCYSSGSSTQSARLGDTSQDGWLGLTGSWHESASCYDLYTTPGSFCDEEQRASLRANVHLTLPAVGHVSESVVVSVQQYHETRGGAYGEGETCDTSYYASDPVFGERYDTLTGSCAVTFPTLP